MHKLAQMMHKMFWISSTLAAPWDEKATLDHIAIADRLGLNHWWLYFIQPTLVWSIYTLSTQLWSVFISTKIWCLCVRLCRMDRWISLNDLKMQLVELIQELWSVNLSQQAAFKSSLNQVLSAVYSVMVTYRWMYESFSALFFHYQV